MNALLVILIALAIWFLACCLIAGSAVRRFCLPPEVVNEMTACFLVAGCAMVFFALLAYMAAGG